VIMRARFLPLVIALAWAPSELAARERPNDTVRRVEVATSRLKLGDIVAGTGELSETDLGPAPAPGVVRLVTREELTALLESQSIQGVEGLPEAVRVSRKLEGLTADRLRALATEAIEATGLRRGIRLKSLQLPPGVKVVSGWETVTASVPKPPRRPGEWPATVVLVFEADGMRVARVAVPAVFEISQSGAMPDLSKGEVVMLIVKSGLVEVSTRATAGDNADVGDTFPVTLRPSGKLVRARLVARDRAVLEGSSP